ncbi:unnamed protein product [Pylaiella littoralis]
MVGVGWSCRIDRRAMSSSHIFLLLLVMLRTRPGAAFAAVGRQRFGNMSDGMARAAGRLRASSTRAYPASLRRSREGGLCMEGRSCAPEITDDTFEAEVLNQEQPVLVFFRAPWCGPCRMVSPVVDEVIAEHGEKLKVLELCTDENPKTVAELKIRNIPTLMLFSERKSVMTVVGAVPKSALVSSIKKHMDL